MKKIVRLTERELINLVKRIIKEDDLNEADPGDGKPDSFPEYEGRTDIYADSVIDKDETDDMKQPMAERFYRRRKLREQFEKSTDYESKSRQICWKYKVQNGDNMWNIFKKYKSAGGSGDWDDFKANMREFDMPVGDMKTEVLKTGTIIPLPMSCRNFKPPM